MWYFVDTGIGVALGFGIINAMWLEAEASRAATAQRRVGSRSGQGFVTHLVFCGHAGTGKTTLAKRLIGPLMRATGEAFCLLDKDTLYGRHSSAAMGALTENPNDRDSPLYLKHLRDPGISRAARHGP